MAPALSRKDRDHHLVLHRSFDADWGIRGVGAFGIHRENRTRGHAIPEHAHARGLEINFQARGRQRYVIGDADFMLEPGTVYVVAPGVRHGSRGAKQSLGLTYYLELDLTERNLLGFQARSAAPLRALLTGLGTCVFPGDASMQGLFEQLATACAKEGAAASFRIRHLLLGIILAVLEGRDRGGMRVRSAPIKRAVAFIETSVAMPTLSDLCRHSGLSYSRLMHRFTEETGESPKAFALRHHIERAQRLLRGSGKAVRVVAEESGFESLKAFYRHFKKWSGMTPLEYRKAT